MHSWADGKQGATPFTVTSLEASARLPSISCVCTLATARDAVQLMRSSAGQRASVQRARPPAWCTATDHGLGFCCSRSCWLLCAIRCWAILGYRWSMGQSGHRRRPGRVLPCRTIAISEPLPVLVQSTCGCKWVKTKALSNLLLALRNRLCPDSHRRGSWCALQWPGGFGRVGSAGASGRQAYLFRATQQLLVVTVHGSARDTVAVTSPPSPKYSRGNQPQCMHTSLRTWFELPTARIVSAPASTGNLSRRLRHR